MFKSKKSKNNNNQEIKLSSKMSYIKTQHFNHTFNIETIETDLGRAYQYKTIFEISFNELKNKICSNNEYFNKINFQDNDYLKCFILGYYNDTFEKAQYEESNYLGISINNIDLYLTQKNDIIENFIKKLMMNDNDIYNFQLNNLIHEYIKEESPLIKKGHGIRGMSDEEFEEIIDQYNKN